jgi:16S rRNA A1518/A1519 N6-dimethyltransferase RsmA/KsgA/DIM1 with predicted DNA glycosylase/AP lyase activity
MSIEEDPEGHETAALGAVVSFASRRVVEIGSGSGRLTRRYAASAGLVTAIDPNAAAIADLANRLPSVDARAIGVEQLVIAQQSVDVVLFSWSL